VGSQRPRDWQRVASGNKRLWKGFDRARTWDKTKGSVKMNGLNSGPIRLGLPASCPGTG
jgi:hypothetical protein